MALKKTDDIFYTGIGNAIRRKNGKQTLYKPSEMEEAIDAIPTGGGSGGFVINFEPVSISMTLGGNE